MAVGSASSMETVPGDGFTLIDGVALVVGSAIAAVHLKGLSDDRSGSSPTLFWISFIGISLTATGPFLHLGRRFLRRSPGYPGLGDRLWTILGLPWALGALLPIPNPSFEQDRLGFYGFFMLLGLALASTVTLVVIWRNWVVLAPEAIKPRENPSWTDRLGLVLAIAWPLQCAFGLMILG